MESFWSTEYGQNLLSVEQTEIDKLLSSPDNNTTLEDLFDEDELLQQCSNKNESLITFLSKHENIEKLITYITRPCHEHIERITKDLELRELKKNENKNNNENDEQKQPPFSPLSKNGTHQIKGIKEETQIQTQTNNDDDDNIDTPQTLAAALISLELDTKDNDKKKDTKNTNKNVTTTNNTNNTKSSNVIIFRPGKGIPPPPPSPAAKSSNTTNNTQQTQTQTHNNNEDTEKKKTFFTSDDIIKDEQEENKKKKEPTQQNNDENTENTEKKENKNDDNDKYDFDLKLSDDDEDNNEEEDDDIELNKNDTQNDTQNDTSNDNPPTIKKKKSVVDILLEGPGFVENEEDNNNNDEDNNDDDNNAPDPEIPDLNIPTNTEDENNESKENKDNNDYNYGNSTLEEESEEAGEEQEEKIQTGTFSFGHDDDLDIPPPPPSKLEEIRTENGKEKVKLKYPYLASEIINCQIPQILDTILDSHNPFLDMLFEFIQQDAPLNAVLTNYWRSCVVGLVRRNSNVVLKYIKSKKNLLSSLVQHIRDQSIMELVIALGWDPAIEELKELDEVADWMYDEQLVPKLIATLSPDRSADEHSAASYTLVDIVAKTSRSTNLVLFHNLSSAEQIDGLMNHMFTGNRSSLLESLSVLLALLHHYPNISAEKQQFNEDINNNNNNDDDVPPPPPTDHDEISINPLAPKQSISDKPEPLTPPSNGGAVLDVSNINENNDTNNNEIMNGSITTINNNINDDDIIFDINTPPVVRAVCLRLEEFKKLLITAPTTTLELPFVVLNPPLGPVRHKVVDMIVALMRTPSDIVSQKLQDLGLIKLCIDLFFEYPWNNLLHGSVEHIIQMVVSGDCMILKQALFEDCNFLNRILNARRLSNEHQEEKRFRLGYMGHITRVSNTIVEFAKRNKQLEGYMKCNTSWMDFIDGDLKLENEKLNTQLGGHRPTTLNGDDEGDEFTLFTLNDITNNIREEEDLLGDYDDDDDDEEDDDDDSDSDDDNNDGVDSNNNNNNNKNKKKKKEGKNDGIQIGNGMTLNAFAAMTMNVDKNKENDKNNNDVTNTITGGDDNGGNNDSKNDGDDGNNKKEYSLPSDDFHGFTQALDDEQQNDDNNDNTKEDNKGIEEKTNNEKKMNVKKNTKNDWDVFDEWTDFYFDDKKKQQLSNGDNNNIQNKTELNGDSTKKELNGDVPTKKKVEEEPKNNNDFDDFFNNIDDMQNDPFFSQNTNNMKKKNNPTENKENTTNNNNNNTNNITQQPLKNNDENEEITTPSPPAILSISPIKKVNNNNNKNENNDHNTNEIQKQQQSITT